MMNISKELLSEVLDKEVTNIKMHHSNDEYIYFDYIGKQSRLANEVSIDIYKLAHKCKKWATEKGYEIVETAFMIRIKRVGQDKQKIWEYPREMQDAGIYFSPSFTFKACQWILDNKDKQ